MQKESSNVYIFEASSEDALKRIDAFLASSIEEISRSYLQKLFELEKIKVNNAIEKSKKYKIKENDIIEVDIPLPKALDVLAEDIPLEIVYEDDDVLVVNKPKGMVVHPAVGNYTGTLVNAIMFHCKERLSSINGVIRPGIVHRIDKDTSGLLMIAKTDLAHEFLSSQLAEHTIERKYVALLYHNIKEEEGTIDAPIGRDPKNRLRQAVIDTNSKAAITHYKVLERFGAYTLIEARLETGRTHQIRVHMAHKKHPLVGDLVYGPSKQKINVEGQMLHAKVLGFVHPITKEYMEFEAPTPQYFEEILHKIREK